MVSPVRRAVVDFDGTCTDTHAEAAPYVIAIPRAFSERFGIPRIALDAMVARYSVEVGQDPTSGWRNGDHIVAPATADPYVFTTAVFGKVYEALFGSDGRDAALGEIHAQCYQGSLTVFRPGVASFLCRLAQFSEVTIVTNSATDAVERKLASLREIESLPALRVIGNAKKYVIDDAWTDVPSAWTPPGFPRPVMLRRRKYADALAAIGSSSEDTAVIGDIYELDLALPELLGYRTVQLITSGTPPWERTHSAPRRSIATGYEEALAALQ